VGCNESPEKQAADRISRQADVARRYYTNAAAISLDPKRVDPNGVDNTAQVCDAALAVLEKAAKEANAAIRNNPQATAIGKVPAYRVLAEINRLKAGYYERLALVQVDETQRLCRRAEFQGLALEDLGHRIDFYHNLASLDVSQIQALLTAARQELQQNQAARKDLADSQQAIEQRLGEAMRQLEPLPVQARQLRQQYNQSKGVESLKVLSQAEQIERQADAQDAQINQLKAQLEQVAAQQKLADTQIEGISGRVTAMEGCLKDVANRGQIVVSHQQELAAGIAATAADTNKRTKELAGTFAAAVEQYDNALKAYADATSANRNVLTGLTKMMSDAQAAQPRGPTPPGGPTLLMSMAAKTGRLPAVAAEGELAMAAGDTGRQMLELVGQVGALQSRLAAAATAAKATLGDDLTAALAKVSDVTTRAETAKGQYEAAQKQFEEAATLANAKEIRGSQWIYQLQRAQATLGLYLLSKAQGQPDAERLADARRQVDDIRKALTSENKSLTVDMASVDVMDQALQQMQ
jgi:chromosome segregation ATPase